MNPQFNHIAELFEPRVSEVRKRVGATSEESAELGRIALNDGDYEGAIAHYRAALDQAPNDPERRKDLAGLLAATDASPAALREYRRILRERPDAEASAGVGDLYRREGRGREALREYDEAVAAEPENPAHHLRLALALRELGERKKALVSIDRAILLRSEDAYSFFLKAEILASLSRFDEALESYRAALELSPGDDHYYVRTAVAFARAGRREEAIKALRLASQLAPENDAYDGMLESLLRLDGRTKEADELAKGLGDLDPYDHDLVERFETEILG